MKLSWTKYSFCQHVMSSILAHYVTSINLRHSDVSLFFVVLPIQLVITTLRKSKQKTNDRTIRRNLSFYFRDFLLTPYKH